MIRPDLDLKSSKSVQDPFPLYAWLRDHDPLHWSESLNAWVVTRYEDVVEIFDRPETFSSDRFRKLDERYASQRPAVRAVAEVLGHWLVFRDPPDHDRLRKLLQSSFTPKQLESSRDRVQSTVDTLLDRVVARGTMHFIRDEVVANCILLLFAGHETTTNLLGNGLFHLLRHPAQAALLRADPSLLHGAVEELLRYDGPVPATVKVATEDVPWHGRTIRRGEMVVPSMASANRDPKQFADPDRLDVRRQPERHVAFAAGMHFCLGAWLARLEARIVFDTVLRRLPELALAPGEPRWKPMIFLRGLESLPLTWGRT